MSGRILIDSELVLAALVAPARLSREARALIDRSEVYVSAASLLEIGLKSADPLLPQDVLAALEPTGFRTLALAPEHVALAAALPATGLDPVDRLLIAQAGTEGMALVTTDAALAAGAALPDREARGGRRPGPRRRARGTGRARGVRAEPAPPRCRVVLAPLAASRKARA